MDMGHIEPFTNVEETKILLNHRAKLWNSIKVWTENVRIWQTSRFEDVDIDRIREESAFHAKIVLQCERNLPPGSSAVAFLKKLVFDFKETVPIVEALGNKNLDEVHWAEIKEILNIRNFPLEEKQFSLGQLVDFDVAHKADDIVNVSITATQENNLRV
jgi:dynein heavy chain